jgi:hypothetical protein
MDQRIVLGMGTGRCGMHALAQFLSQQPDFDVTHEEWPLLSWTSKVAADLIRERFLRIRRKRTARVIGDVAPFYLPYVEEALRLEPNLRVICLQRPREEVVCSFGDWLDKVQPLPTNHWAQETAPGWYHDPVTTRTFPQYDLQDRAAGIARYWDEYSARSSDLATRHPQNVRIVDMAPALNTPEGQREVLRFVGIPDDQHVLAAETRSRQSATARVRRQRFVDDGKPMDPRRCVVLVPFGTHIVPMCETALKELERRGYVVRRVQGYAAIDQGRNQMATDALCEGFEETLWIDSDMGFRPDDVQRIRAHGEPIVTVIAPQKGKRALACHIIPGTEKLTFGEGGGLHEILYAGTGFLHVRREVYTRVQEQLELPLCNEMFKRPMIPFFQPLIRRQHEGTWYLAEDYSFCHRARLCGFRILADTAVRVWHVGNYAYSWEDAGMDRQRFSTFHYNFTSHDSQNGD